MKLVKIAFLFLITLFTGLPEINAADLSGIGVPYVQNYSKSTYQAGNKNWSVAKDATGVMYFGNSGGLLSFDGRYWQLYRMPHKEIVRAVAPDNKGRVYVGGFAEFGFWAYNKAGRFTYQSLTHLLPAADRPSDEIWKIYVDGPRILFQSFSAIFIYEKGKVSVVRGRQPFLFLFKAGRKAFVEVISEGLYELKGKSLQLIPNSKVLGGSGVLSVLPFGRDKYLIGTAKGGLFLYDGREIRPWENQANDFLKNYQLNNGALVLDKFFAYGTILNGLVILDEAGRIVQRINKAGGLQNNTVLSLYTDNNQNLWAGLDNGIDRVEMNSPLYFYFDKAGKFGTVYASIVHDGKLYLGTNQGLFYIDWDTRQQAAPPYDFKLVPGSQGQVWDLSVFDGQLLCGHNEGTFRVQGAQLEQLSDVKGGWVLRKVPQNPNLLLQGTYTGLAVYRKNERGNWAFSHKVEGFGAPSLYVEPDAEGQVWVSHAYRGLYRLRLSPDLREVRATRSFDSSHGLPGDYTTNIFNLEGQIVFSSDSGFYAYDEISNRFSPYTSLNQKLGAFATANKIIKAAGKKYWFINHGKIGLADLAEPGKIRMDASSFGVLNGRMVEFHESISRISHDRYVISVDDGFVFYHANARPGQKKAIPRVLIRRVENTTDHIATLAETGHTQDGIRVPYRRNDIEIFFSLPYYSQAAIRYAYFLEGYSRQWSDWTATTQKGFTNLEPGEYRFLVKARLQDGTESPVTAFVFTVLPPWYATGWAFLVYGLLALGLAFLFQHLYRLKLQADQRRMLRKMEQEKEAALRQEAISNEQKIVRLKNEQLKSELAGKSRELANSALNIVAKNELLQNIQQELLLLKDTAGKKLPEEQLRKIQKVIAESMSDERDWNLFENSFNEAHENYFKKLKAGHPDLTPNDLKLCAYLRMNMSSKEMASLLNITVRGVEIRRYRLRKKLSLEHEKNLTEFLMEL
jgi:ligand-binding sensor domain-containing protein/DNA-binding CsgD family transcriptional regulator